MRQLGEETGAVTGPVGCFCPAVVETVQALHCQPGDPERGRLSPVGDEPDTTGIVLASDLDAGSGHHPSSEENGAC
jgi:hypothetical protein